MARWTLKSVPRFVPSIGNRVAHPPQGSFLNTPLLWLAAGLLIGLLRGPLRNAPAILKKPLKVVVVSCIALGTVILLMWDPVLQTAQQNKPLGPVWILLLGLTSMGWVVSFFWIFLSRSKQKTRAVPFVVGGPAPHPQVQQQAAVRNVPTQRFADVGGMDDAKEQIRQLVRAHLKPREYERYGLTRNGILLYGPRGSGKTFLARATAGEFGLNFECVSAPKLLTR